MVNSTETSHVFPSIGSADDGPTLFLDGDIRPALRRFSLLHPPSAGDYFSLAPHDQIPVSFLEEMFSALVVEGQVEHRSVCLSFSHEALEIVATSPRLRDIVQSVARTGSVLFLSRPQWDAPLGGVSMGELQSQIQSHEESLVALVGQPAVGTFVSCMGEVASNISGKLPRRLYIDGNTLADCSAATGVVGGSLWRRVNTISPVELLSGEFLSRVQQLWQGGVGEVVRLSLSSLWQMKRGGGDPRSLLSQLQEQQRVAAHHGRSLRSTATEGWMMSARNRMQERVLFEFKRLELECRERGDEAFSLWRRLARAPYVTAIDTRHATVVRRVIDTGEFITASESPYEAFMNLIAALEDVRARICRSTVRSAPSEYRA